MCVCVWLVRNEGDDNDTREGHPHLNNLHLVDAGEDAVEEGYFFDDEGHLFAAVENINAVGHVVWVLDEQEDARAENLLRRHGEYKRE